MKTETPTIDSVSIFRRVVVVVVVAVDAVASSIAHVADVAGIYPESCPAVMAILFPSFEPIETSESWCRECGRMCGLDSENE